MHNMTEKKSKMISQEEGLPNQEFLEDEETFFGAVQEDAGNLEVAYQTGEVEFYKQGYDSFKKFCIDRNFQSTQ